MRVLTSIFSIFLLISCGAAKNSDRKDGNGGVPGGNGRSTQAYSVNKFQAAIFSNTYRDRGTVQYTMEEEILATQKGEVPVTLHQIPDYKTHNAEQVIKVASLPNPKKDCGNSELNTIGITTRISDCKGVNAANENSYQWLGKTNGISSEGNWMLVSNSSESLVWVNETTNLLWSDYVVQKADFFKATGTKDGNIDYKDDRVCQSSIKNPQNALGKIHPDLVYWKIPTRNDFFMAEITGAAYVLNTDADLIWTGSYYKDGQAWAIRQSTGELVATDVATELPVRCIGIILK